MKYSAINIGPIVRTLGMARKPRELWAASYMFSYLMKCIYQEAEKDNADIISPAKPQKDNNRVGIYPDRLYVKGEFDAKGIMEKALHAFFQELTSDSNARISENDYFNLMSVSCEANKDSLAIKDLNRKLDIMELCNYATEGNADDAIYEFIAKGAPSLHGNKFFIPDIEEIANANDGKMEKSFQKYFCIVQADGDNVGKTVSHKGLQDGEVKKISDALVDFGLKAADIIIKFGAHPIYAGGDDLLFIAPVIGKDGTHIFELLDNIETQAFSGVRDVVDGLTLKDEDGNDIHASLSFGVSITYYKYPLYEALEKARNLLFGKAKHVKRKNAIAWSLRKHSGGTFEACFSRKDTEVWNKFAELIDATTDKDTVSAVAHKIREKEALVDIVLESGSADRLDALFDKILEFDNDKKAYFNAVKEIMPVLYKRCENKKEYVKMLYSLLRTAKFIKGEDLRDE